MPLRRTAVGTVVATGPILGLSGCGGHDQAAPSATGTPLLPVSTPTPTPTVDPMAAAKTKVLADYQRFVSVRGQGDGGTDQTCAGAGVLWAGTADDPAACTVTYDKSGKYTLSATVGWTVQWWLAGARQDDITGPTKTATRAVTVSEIQTVNR